MTIGKKISKLRTEKNLTQKQLSDICGFSQSALTLWENGKRQPKREQLEKIAKFFDFPLYLLLDDNFELENVELEMKRARPNKSYEMTEPPKPFTVPLSPHNNYDGSIQINPNPEREKLDEEALKLFIKSKSGEEITEEEAQKIFNRDERIREDYVKLGESIRNCVEIFDKLSSENTQIPEQIVQVLKEKLQRLTDMIPTMPNFYENLNDVGRQKVADYISDLSNMPKYQKKPSEPPQE